MNKLVVGTIALLMAMTLMVTGCTESDADVAAKNLSVAAEQFEIDRRIVFFNGITDKYLLVIEGRCSIEKDTGVGGALSVTCKTGKGEFKKHYVGLFSMSKSSTLISRDENLIFIVRYFDDGHLSFANL